MFVEEVLTSRDVDGAVAIGAGSSSHVLLVYGILEQARASAERAREARLLVAT